MFAVSTFGSKNSIPISSDNHIPLIPDSNDLVEYTEQRIGAASNYTSAASGEPIDAGLPPALPTAPAEASAGTAAEIALKAAPPVVAVEGDIPAESSAGVVADMPASAPVASSHNPVANLAAIEAEHARWLESEGKEGKRANLRGLDLSGIDLSGHCLVEASLRGTVLAGANLSGADLRAADLAEAILDDADLSGAKLSGASLARARLARVNASGADMVTANCTAAIAEGIDLSGARLDSIILRDANFRRANLSNASLRGANVRGITAVDSDLSNADLTSADCRDVNFDRAFFAGATLNGANFRGAKLGDVDLMAADFSTALDVSAEIIEQFAKGERDKQQEEQARTTESKMKELDMREQALAAEKEKIAEKVARLNVLEAGQRAYDETLVSYSKGFMISAALWVVFSGAIIALTVIAAMQLEHVKTERLVLIIGMALAALALAIFPMVRSLQLSRVLRAAASALPSQPMTLAEGNGSADKAIAPRRPAGSAAQ